MSDPRTGSVLEGKGTVGSTVFFGDLSSEVTVFSYSGWAGDKDTGKSSSAGVALVDRRSSSGGSVRSKIGPEHDV